MNSSWNKGRWGEEVAVGYLKRKDFQILARNYQSRYGEIDIIAATAQYIVFVEVKLRKRDALVSPVEAVSRTKQKKIIQTALCYLAEFSTDLQPRFDIIEVLEPMEQERSACQLRRIENAFSLEVGNGIF